MMIREINLSSSKQNQIIDITKEVGNIVNQSGVSQGLCIVYVPHATAAIMINENYDPNVCEDILDSLRENIPEGKWKHDRVDNNAAEHIKAGIIGPSELIPIKERKLMLGTWQSIMLADFDGPKKRRIIVQIIEDN